MQDRFGLQVKPDFKVLLLIDPIIITTMKTLPTSYMHQRLKKDWTRIESFVMRNFVNSMILKIESITLLKSILLQSSPPILSHILMRDSENIGRSK